jgi:hypothetical protein
MPPLFTSSNNRKRHRHGALARVRSMSNNIITVGNTYATGGATSIVDQLTSVTCVAAYSTHTKLVDAYAGSYFQVRWSGGNTDIGGATPETTMEAALGANNGFVRTLYDQSGNTRNFTQTTNNDQPKIHDSATGGLHGATNNLLCMTFDGSNHFLVRAAGIGLTGDPSITVVCDSDSSANGDRALWCFGSDAAGPLSMFWNSVANGDITFDNWSSAAQWGTSSNRDAPSRWVMTRSAGSNMSDTLVYRNNTALTRTSGTDTNKPNLDNLACNLGAHTFSGGGQFLWAGSFTTLMVFSGVMSSGDRSTLETWFATHCV